ncbi:MAG: hypothetical protein KC649_01190, partial [Candidatus Omnitrophica bacterium]|nr:hypothetical protein [Candidatus Omnitrophota bacterium]
MINAYKRIVSVLVCIAWVGSQPVFALNDYTSTRNFDEGISSYLKGDYEKSLESFRAYAKDHPDHLVTQQWIDVISTLKSQSSMSQFAIETAAINSVSAAAVNPAVLQSEVGLLKKQLAFQKQAMEQEISGQLSQLEEVSELLSETRREYEASEQKRREVEEELKKIVTYQSQSDDALATLDAARELARMREQLETTLKNYASSEKSRMSLNRRLEDIVEQKNKLSRELSALSQSHDELKMQFTLSQNEVSHVHEELQQAASIKSDLSSTVIKLQEKIDLLQLSLGDKETELKDISQHYSQKSKEDAAGYAQKEKQLKSEIEQLQSQLKEEKQTVSTLKKSESKLEGNLAELTRRFTEARDTADSLQQQLNTVSKSKSQIENKLADAEKKQAEGQKQIQSLSRQIETLTEAKSFLESSIDNLSKSLEASESKLSRAVDENQKLTAV